MMRTHRLAVALLSIALVVALPLFSSMAPATGEPGHNEEITASPRTTIFSILLSYLIDSLRDLPLQDTDTGEAGAVSATPGPSIAPDARYEEQRTAATPPDANDTSGINETATETGTGEVDAETTAGNDTAPETPESAPDTEAPDEQNASTNQTADTPANTTAPDTDMPPQNSTSNSTVDEEETTSDNASSQEEPDNITAEADDEAGAPDDLTNATENDTTPPDTATEGPTNTTAPPEAENATHNQTAMPGANESAGNDTSQRGWTIMVYLDGDNSVDSYARKELNEIASAPTGRNVTVLVLYDGKGGGTSYLYRGANDSWEHLPLQEINDTWGEEVNMGHPDTLEEFVSYGLAHAGHGQYMLELWSHGYGWAGICRDETANDQLTMNEIQQALAGACEDGEKIDLLVYTACKMADLEVAYGLETYVDYFVASQESVPALGLPHTAIIEIAAHNASVDAATFAGQIVDAYTAFYHTAQTATIAAWKLAGMSKLAGAVDELAQALSSETVDGTMIYNAVAATPSFGGLGFIDLHDFALNIYGSCPNGSTAAIAAQRVTENVSAVIHHEWHGSYHQDAHGMSIYFPVASYLSWYGDLLFASDTGWDSFLQCYCGG